MQHKDPFQPWRIVERHEVLEVPGRFSIAVEIVELPDGRRVDDYWQMKGLDYVVVFAETVEGEVVCLRQYRHGTRRVGLELIAGMIEKDEAPLDAARRELLEEAGYATLHWEALGSFKVSSTMGIGSVSAFRARQAGKRQEPCCNDLEYTEVKLLNRNELRAALCAGEFAAASHIATMGLALLTQTDSWPNACG